jgi:hypothetical protein
LATHDPGKIVCDLALSLALGGDCLSDLSEVRAEPGLYGPVASDPTVSRLIALLGDDAERAEKAIGRARKAARARVWALAGDHAPNSGISAADPLIIDVDATLVTAHSDKEQAAPTFKKGYGHHPLCAFIDHGTHGSGEMAAVMLRPGNAGSNTAADHTTVIRAALDQAGVGSRPGRKVLVRIDGAGSTHETLNELVRRRVSYSVGFTLPMDTPELYEKIPEEVWTPAYTSDGGVREGADVAEFTGLLDLSGWPAGMRVIVRREYPDAGAELRFDDVDGYRLTAFATNATKGQLPDLEVRHRRREPRTRPDLRHHACRTWPGHAGHRTWPQTGRALEYPVRDRHVAVFRKAPDRPSLESAIYGPACGLSRGRPVCGRFHHHGTWVEKPEHRNLDPTQRRNASSSTRRLI